MAGNLGTRPSSSGWKPPSGREHPPAAGAHCPGTSGNKDTSAAGSNQANAVTRPPNGLKTK